MRTINANPLACFFRHSYLINFVLFNLTFLGLQFFYIFSLSGNFIQALPLPWQVYFEIILAILIQFVLYIVLSLAQTGLLLGITEKRRPTWQIFIFVLTIACLISLNCYLFPLSVFSRLFLPETPKIVILTILVFSSIALILLIINALIKLQKIGCILFLLSLSLILFAFIPDSHQSSAPILTNNRPNIILIGIDSLSPERVNAQDTPAMHHFLKESLQFKETISPLARTYPAWSTILTGLYPIHHQARENLVPSSGVRSDRSLAWELRKKGYFTLFATDDRRFNNLGKEFGFNKIIGPQLGVNDVLLGTFNDFPLSNLIINFKISRWLFPYNHMNRASHYSYYPKTFDLALKQALEKKPYQQPLLFAVHFTLPHWPYAWAKSDPAEVGDEYRVSKRNKLYMDAVRKADQQVGQLLKNLEQQGLLQNSLIFLLSDHGEALYNENSRLTDPALYQGGYPGQLADYFTRKTSTTLQKSAGHGSDLLSPSQFRCLLGIKIFKNNHIISSSGSINTRVSLMDILPTIEAFLQIPSTAQKDGISLLDTVLQPSHKLPDRKFMLESGMFPNQFISRNKAKEYGKLLFRVNSKNHYLEIKHHQLKKIDAMKLYGIIQNDWLLALYPDDKKYLSIIVRLSDGQWTDDPHSLLATTSPFSFLLQQLLEFYATDLAHYPEVLVPFDSA